MLHAIVSDILDERLNPKRTQTDQRLRVPLMFNARDRDHLRLGIFAARLQLIQKPIGVWLQPEWLRTGRHVLGRHVCGRDVMRQHATLAGAHRVDACIGGDAVQPRSK